MHTRRVTVFGGSGFIGRHIVRRLAQNGTVVRVAVRDPEQALFLKPMGAVGQIVPIAADVTDAASVRVALNGVDAAINLVGILHESGRATFKSTHVDGAKTVAETAAQMGVKSLLHLSALGAEHNAAATYARSKAEGEARVREAFPDAIIFRPSVVFGPEDSFLNRFAAMARYLPMLPVIGTPALPRIKRTDGRTQIDVYGEGGPCFQPVYVGDVADAAISALKERSARGQTFELGGPETFTFKELMELVLSATGRRRLLMPVPYGLASFNAFFLERLPNPMLTRDQVKLLKTDNILSGTAPGLGTLGVRPTALSAMAPLYLSRYRKAGEAHEASS